MRELVEELAHFRRDLRALMVLLAEVAARLGPTPRALPFARPGSPAQLVPGLPSGTNRTPASRAVPGTVLVTTGSTPLFTENPNRLAWILVNEGEQTIHVTLGTSAAITSETFPLHPGDVYIDGTGWTGAVTAIVAMGTCLINTTELFQ